MGATAACATQAGIPVTRLVYGQSAVVCAVAHEKPHQGVALEHFLPGGPFAQLPMSGNEQHEHLSAIVFTDRHDVVKRLGVLDDARFTREVAKRLGDHLGAVTLVGRRWTYPLSAMHAARYFDTRLALIGDAAHGVHPIAGQGLNLGLQDALALIDLLEDAPDPGDPALLAAYQAARRPANLTDAGRDRRAGPAVFNQQPGNPAGARSRPGRGRPHAALETALHADGDGTVGEESGLLFVNKKQQKNFF